MQIFINGKPFEAEAGQTILEAAREHGFHIPTLCFLKECQNTGKCGICRVEVEGNENLVGACGTAVEEGMKIRTNSRRVQEAVKAKMEELLTDHNFSCGTCMRKRDCEFLKLVKLVHARIPDEAARILKERINGEFAEKRDERSVSIVRDESKCIRCGRCVSACHTKSGTDIMQPNGEEGHEIMAPLELKCFDQTGCLLCGQCVAACPVGALSEKSSLIQVRKALADPAKHVVVGMAPSVRTALGEAFGYPYGTDVTGKVYAALRRMNFKKVYDVNFAADMTIMEEGTELISRIQAGGPFPMFTSCCPGWIRLVENYYPELMPNVSSAKSPQQMFGAMTKSYYADTNHIDPESVFTVTVMPCTAKKFEAARREMTDRRGIRDVDAVLDTRELASLVLDAGICFSQLPDEEADPDMGYYTGAAVIFGATGGVMEAALRTAKDLMEQVSLETVDYQDVRGLEGVKEAVVKIAGSEYRIAVIHGAANLFHFMESGKLKDKDYHFIEVMACPGGCVNGGGQPHVSAADRETHNFCKERADVLYRQDSRLTYRKSHKNPYILNMYQEYLGDVGGEKAHSLLHVRYEK